jgi:uncharacterized membrane protein HdeD (DUF308 family)
MKTRWWIVSAVAIGALMLMLGIGNLMDPDDTGPLYGQLILLAVMATGAVLIASGVVLVRRKNARGAKLVALGVLPGSVGTAFFWFPPAVVVGILAVITSWAAFRSTENVEGQIATS